MNQPGQLKIFKIIIFLVLFFTVAYLIHVSNSWNVFEDSLVTTLLNCIEKKFLIVQSTNVKFFAPFLIFWSEWTSFSRHVVVKTNAKTLQLLIWLSPLIKYRTKYLRSLCVSTRKPFNYFPFQSIITNFATCWNELLLKFVILPTTINPSLSLRIFQFLATTMSSKCLLEFQ